MITIMNQVFMSLCMVALWVTQAVKTNPHSLSESMQGIMNSDHAEIRSLSFFGGVSDAVGDAGPRSCDLSTRRGGIIWK